MGVPVTVVRGAGDAGPIHPDERHPGFDQPAGEQEALAEPGMPVPGAEPRVFGGEVEGPPGGRGRDEVERLPDPSVVSLPAGGFADPGEPAVDSPSNPRRPASRDDDTSAGRPRPGTANDGEAGSQLISHGSAARPRNPPSWPGQVRFPSFADSSGSVTAAGRGVARGHTFLTIAPRLGQSFGAPGFPFSTPAGVCGTPVVM